MAYVFMSFASLHGRGNLGCCIVQVEDPETANDECKKLGLMPDSCNHVQGFVLSDDEFKLQGMELNRLYSSAEMQQMGFEGR